MRVVYIFPELRGCGPENQVFYLLSGLVKHGHEVFLFSFSKTVALNERVVRFKDAGVFVCQFKLSVFSLVDVRSLLASIAPDLIHSSTLVGDILALVLGVGFKRFVTHRTSPQDHLASRGLFVGSMMYLLSKLVSSLAYKSIACSHAVFNDLNAKRFKADLVVQNCVSSSFYSRFANPKWGDFGSILRDENELNVISVGALSERKNPMRTRRILSLFGELFDVNINLWFLGEGPLKKSLLGSSVEDKVSVKCFGQVEDIRPFLRESFIHFSSSRAEGLPNSVLETLSCGIVNILSDIPEHREISISAEPLVFLFKLNDEDQVICHELKRFLINFEGADRALVRNFRSDFSEDRMVSSYITSYHSL